jgi:hypothetical protein
LPTNQSTVQGSGIGPLLFISFAFDLKLLYSVNRLCKYADRTTLVEPENSDFRLEDEFQHVERASVQNKLDLNLAKTTEMNFHRHSPRHFINPPLLDNIERVAAFQLREMLLISALTMDKHINHILSVVNQRLFYLICFENKECLTRLKTASFRLDYIMPYLRYACFS